MIRNYGDHAANERTFLAWVRTAIAIMAFGFLVERFDLFLRMARVSLGVTARLSGRAFGEAAGLVLMLLGLAIVMVAAVRFVRTGRHIDDAESHLGPGARLDLALAALLFLLGCALLAYLVLNILSRR